MDPIPHVEQESWPLNPVRKLGVRSVASQPAQLKVDPMGILGSASSRSNISQRSR